MRLRLVYLVLIFSFVVFVTGPGCGEKPEEEAAKGAKEAKEVVTEDLEPSPEKEIVEEAKEVPEKSAEAVQKVEQEIESKVGEIEEALAEKTPEPQKEAVEAKKVVQETTEPVEGVEEKVESQVEEVKEATKQKMMEEVEEVVAEPEVAKEVALEPSLEIAEAAICTEVSNRTPIGIAEAFPPDINNLCCFTAVVGALRETFIRHLWFFGDQMMAEITLPVKSVRWRTYSSKKILPQWQGPWRVEIQDENGETLTKIDFEIR
jgi:hypothetical protein